MVDDKKPYEELDPTERINDDLPCVRCGYNLRGLSDDGQCPECGAAVAETLEFVRARVLCPACLAPNHPSAAICGECKAAISGAAAMADYFRSPGRFHGNRSMEGQEREPEEPAQGILVLRWIVGMVVMILAGLAAVALWDEQHTLLAVGLIVGAALAAGADFFYSLRDYRQRWKSYTAALAEYETKQDAADAQADLRNAE